MEERSGEKNWSQQALNIIGRWRQQPKKELDGEDWSVAYALQE